MHNRSEVSCDQAGEWLKKSLLVVCVYRNPDSTDESNDELYRV